MSWTQPICERCWDKAYPDRPAARLMLAESETCCECGQPTKSGIYVRRDPREVPYPSEVK